jgi:hypothetical protein
VHVLDHTQTDHRQTPAVSHAHSVLYLEKPWVGVTLLCISRVLCTFYSYCCYGGAAKWLDASWMTARRILTVALGYSFFPPQPEQLFTYSLIIRGISVSYGLYDQSSDQRVQNGYAANLIYCNENSRIKKRSALIYLGTRSGMVAAPIFMRPASVSSYMLGRSSCSRPIRSAFYRISHATADWYNQFYEWRLGIILKSYSPLHQNYVHEKSFEIWLFSVNIPTRGCGANIFRGRIRFKVIFWCGCSGI